MPEKKKRLVAILAIIVVICLLSSSYFLSIDLSSEEKIIEESGEYEIDNRISPLTNQGLILEINRVRHRDLLDKIMKIGTSWRKKPTFYIITNIDDGEYSSYKEHGFTYNTWDTIGQEFRNIRDIEEEQSTSKITITIVEQVKKGIFRTQDIEKEKIEIIYDYRTGRWKGNDFFDDNDGYGHFVGETFEAWFNIYQTDYDEDSIPYWTELNILKTDPQVDDSKLDPDNDGIPTSWEWKWGYDPHIWDDHATLDPDIDGIENIEEYQMGKWFANPFQQDIYIEVDGMKKSGLFGKDYILYEETKQIIIERFCRHKINIYIDNGWPGVQTNGGELLPYDDKKISWKSGTILQYYKHHFPDEREKIFRYVLICGNSKPNAFCGNTEFNRFDTIVIAADINTKLRVWTAFTPRTQRTTLASVFLHELGHSLGIGPNTIAGCDNSSFKNRYLPSKSRTKYLEQWGNYKSVMNYFYLNNKKIVDLSDGSHGDNDQNDWEKIYLPFFQIEVDIVVDPFYYPITKDGVDENVSIELDGWNYSLNLTKKYEKTVTDWSPIDPVKCEWSIFVKIDDDSLSNRNIRVYVKPIVPFSVWGLFKEGYLDSKGTINLV